MVPLGGRFAKPRLGLDPLDRMLVAQAQSEELPVLSADPKLAMYEVETLS
jgi:PIN domain nuclease of toxin-antitoxin system